MAKDIIPAIRRELEQQVDEKTKSSYRRVFKEKVTYYGVSNSVASKIAKKYFPEIKSFGKKAIFLLCEELLKSDYSEEAFIAFEWAYQRRKEYEPGDFVTFDNWLNKYINNWAKCDTLCNHTIGSFMEMYPRFIKHLKQWARSENRWLRRAAAVTLIIPAKRGKFLEDILEIADILLRDQDDLVQKVYGWLLKDASITHQAEIFDYVTKNNKLMPRTALRYAVERLPPELKRRAMAK